jgi:hypothetical protein
MYMQLISYILKNLIENVRVIIFLINKY